MLAASGWPRGRHVDGPRMHRGALGRAGGLWRLARDERRCRLQRRAADPRGGPGGRRDRRSAPREGDPAVRGGPQRRTDVAAVPTLDRRTLNRTLLARQGLLERVDRPALDVVEELVGLQAQEPPDPYVALWSRIDGFDPVDARRRDRRSGAPSGWVSLRGTLHLVTAADARRLVPGPARRARASLPQLAVRQDAGRRRHGRHRRGGACRSWRPSR